MLVNDTRAYARTRKCTGMQTKCMLQVHLFSILPECLVERAKVWTNKLALKKEWVMVTKPYFCAPGQSAYGYQHHVL